MERILTSSNAILRPYTIYNGSVESHIQHVEALQWSVEVCWEMRWRKEVMKAFNYVEFWILSDRDAMCRVSVGWNGRVRCMHRHVRVEDNGTRREKRWEN